MEFQSKEQQAVWYGFVASVGLGLCFIVLSLLALLNDGRAQMPAELMKAKLPYHFVLLHKHKHTKKDFQGNVLERQIVAHVNIIDPKSHRPQASKKFIYGVHRMWWSNGSLRLLERYCEKHMFDRGECRLGKLHGTSQGWFRNGQIRWEKHYRNGVPTGKYRTWYKKAKAKLRSSVTYKRGKKHGLFRMWRGDGSKLIEGRYQHGKKHGLWKRWYPNGKLMETSTYNQGSLHGPWSQWFWICRNLGCSHIKSQEGTYQQGQKHGQWLLWNVSSGAVTKQIWKQGKRI